FNPNIAYGLYEVVDVMTEEELGFPPYVKSGDKLILADNLAGHALNAAKVREGGFKRVCNVDPTGWTLSHPFSEMDQFFQLPIPLLSGDHVTDDAGTGFVHTAPAHGEDDYAVWTRNAM